MDEPLSPDNPEARPGTQMTLAVLVISVFLALGKLMGYVKEMLLAWYFGPSRTTDAFKAVYNGLVVLVYTRFEALLRPTYLPVFVEHHERDGESEAWRLTGAIATLATLALLVLAAGAVMLAEPLMAWLWHGQPATPAEMKTGVMLVRIMVPAMVALALSVLPELTLHAQRRFTLPAVADACFKAAVPLVMIALLGLLWKPGDPRAIYAAGWAVVIGSLLRLGLPLLGLCPNLGHLRLSLNLRSIPGALRVVGLMPPVVLGLVFSAIRIWTDIYVTGQMTPGAYTALDFGRKLSDLAVLILPLAVSFVVYPYLSAWSLQDNRQQMADTLVAMTRVMAFIFIPLTVAVLLLARPLSSLVFEIGRTTSEDVALISLALRCYAAGIFFFALEGSLNKWYFAMQDTGTPNYVGAAGVILHVLIAYGGGLMLGWGLVAVALATTLSKSVKVIVLYGLLHGRIGTIRASEVYAFAAKLLVGTAIMGAVVYFTGEALAARLPGWQPPVAAAKLRVLALLAGTSVAGGGVFLVISALLRIEELSMVSQYIREKIITRFGQAH